MLNRLGSLSLKAFEFALDTLAPQDPEIRSIERMSPSEFAEKAAREQVEGAIKGVLSLFSYKDPLVKAAILEVKSYGNRKISRLIGKVVLEELLEELSEREAFENFSSPLLVPVPMTKKSLRRRGWNQCELIAREIALADGGRSLELRTDALAKRRETADQVGKSRSERLANLKECFWVADPERVRGRNVVILDDIATTGATLAEARRAILRAGARKALCVAFCH